VADPKRIAALHKQGGVYKPMSEITPGTQDMLDMPTPAWLDRDYPYVAPPDESYTLKELDYLTSLIPLRAQWGSFVKAADEDMTGLFVTLCSELGVPCDRQALDAMASDAAILITKMKWLYNRPRPYQIAARHGVPFAPMGTVTAHSPAYPSGHTIQAYLLASRLSEVAPQHRKAFMDLAHMISFSRMVGGYHWPSDISFGKDVFRHIVMPHMPSSVRVASTYLRSKTACIISVGEWGGKKCLFKNRDRNYTPDIRIYHKVIDGVEVLYMKDELTGWCEGLNEYGIGIVNAALAVHADEKAGKAGKGKSDDPATQNTLRDGKRMLKGLACKSLDDAVEAVKTHMGGLRGHTFVADPEKTVSLEATWRGHDFHQRKLPQSRKHVRTNHGQFYQDAGYTEDSGDDYLSSLARRDQAMKLLRGIDAYDQIAPTIYGKRRKDKADPLNMVKMTDGMRTNTQVVMNLSDGEMLFYLLPGQVEFLGYQNDLPKNRKPKLTLKVMQYTDLDGDGQYEVEEIEHAS